MDTQEVPGAVDHGPKQPEFKECLDSALTYGLVSRWSCVETGFGLCSGIHRTIDLHTGLDIYQGEFFLLDEITGCIEEVVSRYVKK